MPPKRHVSQIIPGSLYSDCSGQRFRSPEIDADIDRRMLQEKDEKEDARASLMPAAGDSSILRLRLTLLLEA